MTWKGKWKRGSPEKVPKSNCIERHLLPKDWVEDVSVLIETTYSLIDLEIALTELARARLEIEELRQRLYRRNTNLIFVQIMFGLAFALAAILLIGSSLSWLVVPVEVQVVLAGSIIAEMVAIYFFVIRFYFGTYKDDKEGDDDEAK